MKKFIFLYPGILLLDIIYTFLYDQFLIPTVLIHSIFFKEKFSDNSI